MYNCILVPLDGSRTAEQALPYARWLAESFRISIELLAVIDTESFTAAVSIDRAHSATIIAAGSKRDGAAFNAAGNSCRPTRNRPQIDRHDRGGMINRSRLMRAAGCFCWSHNEGSRSVGLRLWSCAN